MEQKFGTVETCIFFKYLQEPNQQSQNQSGVPKHPGLEPGLRLAARSGTPEGGLRSMRAYTRPGSSFLVVLSTPCIDLNHNIRS